VVVAFGEFVVLVDGEEVEALAGHFPGAGGGVVGGVFRGGGAAGFGGA
jgi:hypothetical protein